MRFTATVQALPSPVGLQCGDESEKKGIVKSARKEEMTRFGNWLGGNCEKKEEVHDDSTLLRSQCS